MSKIQASKFRLSRRVGKSIHGRSNDSINYKNYFCGQHGQTVMRKASEFAVQLIAKQSLKFCHNITEKQLRNYFKKALQSKGDTGQNLIGLLNSRLDIVMFQANFSNSIYAASQLISHGNVLVNGKSVNIRSYLLKASDVISLSNKAMSFDIIDVSIQKKERVVPEYLVTDTTAKTIKFNRVPMVNEVPYAFKPEPHLVVEYYSR